MLRESEGKFAEEEQRLNGLKAKHAQLTQAEAKAQAAQRDRELAQEEVNQLKLRIDQSNYSRLQTEAQALEQQLDDLHKSVAEAKQNKADLEKKCASLKR